MSDGPRFVHVSHLEGLAAVGMIKRYWFEDCDYPGARRVHAITIEGEHLVTKCIDERGAKKVALYMAEAGRLAPLVVTGVDTGEREEVYVGDEE